MPAQQSCPDVDSWQAWLADAASPEQREWYERHLESCTACQQNLDQGDACAQALRSLGWRAGDPTATPPEPALSRVLERLHEGKALSGAAPAGPADLYFLTPSDLPGLLGTLGGYEVLEVVGQGGMGVVLKAHEPALNRFVAIKVMAAAVAGSATARRRFTREAQAAAAVSHDHIMAVHGVHEVEGLPYLVMQYVAGESLQDRLDRTGPLDVEEVVRIGLQTASGLAAAHAQGLIHRDIKPANLLLENGLARVKITDFGLARMADDAGLTRDGVVAGTPEYMAPEQARGEHVDHRADLYSLGAVLYACCTGRPPFRGATALAVLRRVNDEEAAPLRSLNPSAPAWLEALVARLMAKDPAERFQSAAAVATLLEGYLAHLRQPTTFPAPAVPPLPAGRRSGKARAGWSRRALGLAALVLVMTLGVGAALQFAGAQKTPSDLQAYVQTFKGGTECPPGFKVFGPGAGEDVRFQPDGLRITLPAGSPRDGGAAGVKSTFGVRGDFEITVGFEFLAESPPADPALGTRFTLEAPLDRPGSNAASISHRTAKAGAAFFPWVSLWNDTAGGNHRRSKSIPTGARVGRLRLARAGRTLSYYASEGRDGNFVLLQQYPFGDEDLNEVVLAGATEDPQASLDVLVTDLHIRAASLPNLPETAAPTPAGAAKGRGWLIAAALIGLLTAAALAMGWLLARRARGARPAPAPDSAVKPAAAAPPIALSCPGCGHGLKVKAELAGKKGKCPRCGHVLTVPTLAADRPAPARKGNRPLPLRALSLLLGLPLLLVLLALGVWRLGFHEAQHEAPTASLIGVRLGGEPVPDVEESGFSYQEDDKGEPFRWTDGDGTLVIPIDKAAPPQALEVRLHAYLRADTSSFSPEGRSSATFLPC